MKIDCYAGLEYVRVRVAKKAIPMPIALKLEKEIAREIIKHKPIRGKEFLFLRKQVGLSLFKFANFFDSAFDPSTLGKWEKKPEERLSKANEVFVRIYLARHFNLKIDFEPDMLIPAENDYEIELSA